MAAPSMPWSCIASTDARRAGVCPRCCSTSVSATPGARLEGVVPLAVAALATKRGKDAMDAPAPKEAGSAIPGEEVPSLITEATPAAGSLGAIVVSSDTVTTSSLLAFLALPVGAATSSAFLFQEGSSSATTGGTLATDGWPIFLTPVLPNDYMS